MDKYTSQDTQAGRITATVVEVVLEDLRGRRGVGDELEGVDRDVRREMMHTLHRKVWEALTRECGLDPDH